MLEKVVIAFSGLYHIKLYGNPESHFYVRSFGIQYLVNPEAPRTSRKV